MSSVENNQSIYVQNQSAIDKRLNQLEQFTRRDNLIFVGLRIPVQSTSASTASRSTYAQSEGQFDLITSEVIRLCHDALKIVVKPEEISAAHVLPNRSALHRLVPSQ